jgi:rod shape-determining protein MreC
VAFRDSPFQALKAPLTWTAAAIALVLGLAALGLFMTDHRSAASATAYGPVRGEFDEVMEPVASVLSAPLRWAGAAADYGSSYFFAVSENRSLKAQVAALQRSRDELIALRNLTARYQALLRLRTEPPIPMVGARAVSDAHGPFSDARLLDAGSSAGVKIGNPAMNEDGVLGRIVGVSPAASRLMLLTDVESRTPVLDDRTNARAILTGDGGPNPKLDFVRGVGALKDGDRILTSGDGGLFPRGLPVGVAAQDFRGVWRVRLYSDHSALDVVRVLLYDDFSQTVDQAALNDAGMPALTAQEQREVLAAKAAAARPPPSSAPAPPAASAAPAPAGSGVTAAAPAAPSLPPPGAGARDAQSPGPAPPTHARRRAPALGGASAADAPQGSGSVPVSASAPLGNATP